MKSNVSLHLRGKSAEVLASIIRSHSDQCHNILLLADTALIWPLSKAAVERGYSHLTRVKTLLRSTTSQENLEEFSFY